MTVLSISKILTQPQNRLWRIAADLSAAPRWVRGVEQAQHLRGHAQGLDGEWRFQIRLEAGAQSIEMEITEWLEGERFSLRPSRQTRILGGMELFQLTFELREAAAAQTTISIQCEYEPRSKFGRLKNLAFLRRQYIEYLYEIVAALEQLATTESSQAN